MEIFFSILLGMGLAVACGFKIFVPFLIISIASLSGHLELAHGFEFIGTVPMLIVLIVATILEIAAYYIPFVDNLLDMLSMPIAIICGILITVSCIQGLSPMFSWVLAAITGGTVAGGSKLISSSVRALSTTTTGGLGNFIVSTFDTIFSVILSITAIFIPFLIVFVIILLVISFIFIIVKVKRKKLVI